MAFRGGDSFRPADKLGMVAPQYRSRKRKADELFGDKLEELRKKPVFEALGEAPAKASNSPQFSQRMWKTFSKSHAAIADQAYADVPMNEINDYILEKADEFTKIYKHKSENKRIIGVRGTASAADVALDLTLPFKDVKTSDRYKQSKALVDDYLRSLGADRGTIEVVGHSLGGHLADELGKEINADRVLQFNSYRSGREGEKTEHYVTSGDPLQIANKALGRESDSSRVVKSDAGHSISNFLDENLDTEESAALHSSEENRLARADAEKYRESQHDFWAKRKAEELAHRRGQRIE